MPLPVLDFHTAFAMTALSAWAQIGLLWLLGRRFWGLGLPYAMGATACFGGASLCLAMQSSWPYQTSLLAGLFLLIGGISLLSMCVQRLRPPSWSDETLCLLGLPWLLLFLGLWLLPSDGPMQWTLGVGICGLQLGWLLYRLQRLRRYTPGSGWVMVVGAVLVQLGGLLAWLAAGEAQAPAWMLWALCLSQFLGWQTLAGGYVRMLHDYHGERERRAATLDALTQLPSRRTLTEYATLALTQAAHEGTTLGVLVLDIDHFQQVSDRHGPLAGDAVVRRVAWVLRNQLRQQDFAARYAGEEFVVLLPQASPAVLLSTAQRIVDAVRAEAVVAEGARMEVTVSLGGHVQHASPGLCWEELLATADAAFYEAKHEGGDRVVLSAVSRAQLAPAQPEPGHGPPHRGPDAGERHDDARH